jgi:HEPN domain-containing protein
MTPSKQEKLFRPEYALELIRIARGDLGSAQLLLDHFAEREGRAENIFFLAQQSIEKSLKAALCALAIPVPMVHELGILVGKIPPSANPQFGYELAALSEFASIRRYEEGALMLSLEEARDVVDKARAILVWAQGLVGASKAPRGEC